MGSKTLRGTVAVVTGASSGIGAATARRLADDGAAVALIARRADRLSALARNIEAAGARALVVESDVSNGESVRDAVDHVTTELGRLDILVNNAGIMLNGPVLDAPADEWEQMLAVNVEGLLAMTRAALPHLIDAAKDSPRRVADLVTISSTAGRVARAGTAVYSLTKFGVTAFSESLRQELVASRVRVGVVEPGTVDTELASHLRDGIRQASQQQIQAIEAMQPSDVADAVSYMVTRDRRVAVNEVLVRAAEQTW